MVHHIGQFLSPPVASDSILYIPLTWNIRYHLNWRKRPVELQVFLTLRTFWYLIFISATCNWLRMWCCSLSSPAPPHHPSPYQLSRRWWWGWGLKYTTVSYEQCRFFSRKLWFVSQDRKSLYLIRFFEYLWNRFTIDSFVHFAKFFRKKIHWYLLIQQHSLILLIKKFLSEINIKTYSF